MTDRELMQQALKALSAMLTHMGMDEDDWNKPTFNQCRKAEDALRERLAQPEQEPVAQEPVDKAGSSCPEFWDWLSKAYRDGDKGADPKFTKYNMEVAYVAGSTTYKELLNKSEARLHEIAVHCERVERRLKDVNTAAMNLTHDLVCMDYDNDDRLDRDRVMERIMQWRNEWDKAMFKERNT